jgi:hypothetical protein
MSPDAGALIPFSNHHITVERLLNYFFTMGEKLHHHPAVNQALVYKAVFLCFAILNETKTAMV